MTKTPEELAFLAAIRADPDNDTVRLAYADYLNELETPSVDWDCRTSCGIRHADCCRLAGGTGFVPDNSNHDRAELIRVQCELARELVDIPELHHNTLDMILDPDSREDQTWKHRVWGLRDRANVLLAANADRWRKGPVCRTCNGSALWSGATFAVPQQTNNGCPDCFGTGDAGGLMRRFNVLDEYGAARGDELVNVTYHCGMKRVECRSFHVWRYKTDHDNPGSGIYLPTKWALQLLHHPDIVEIRITDLVPTKSDWNSDKTNQPMWGWLPSRNDPASYPRCRIPPQIHDLMTTQERASPHSTWKWFYTEQLAHTALARTTVQWLWSFG